jgi:lysophospholipase L1-like esterase
MATLITDNFDRTDSDSLGSDWSEDSGDIDIVSNRAKTTAASRARWVGTFNPASADYEIEAKLEKQGGVGGVGFMFRYQDANNYYYVAMNTFAQNVYVVKVVAGSGIYDNVIGEYVGGYTNNEIHTVKVVLSGTSIKVYVNGTLRIDEVDSEFSSAGEVGLWSDAADGFINDFIVTGDEAGAGTNTNDERAARLTGTATPSNDERSAKITGYVPDTLKLLPLGDSISEGWPDDFGYRNHLQDLLGIGVYDFVGPFTDPDSDATYDVDHAGVGGERTDQIESRVDSTLDTYMTNLESGSCVLIHAGTNDANQNYSGGATAWVANVEDMIDLIHAHDSSIDIYVALIIPSTDGTINGRITTFNAALESMLETYQGTKANLYIVDMYARFTSNVDWASEWMYDSLHPNDTGYSIMADEWFKAINGVNDERSTKTTGQDTDSDERAAKVEGSGGSNAERSAKALGMDTENSERAGIITGVDSISVERDSRLLGQIHVPNSAIELDGINQYVSLGTLGNFGSNLGNGLYISFDIKTTQTTKASFGFFNDGTTLGIRPKLNMDQSGNLSSGKIGLYFRAHNGAFIDAATTSATDFNDGQIHNIEISVSGDTVTIKVDGDSKPISYRAQTTLTSFANLGYAFAIGASNGRGVFSEFLNGIVDNFKIGTLTSLYGEYSFDEGTGTTVANKAMPSLAASLVNTPQWVLGLDEASQGSTKSAKTTGQERTFLYLDDFNRANSSDLGTNWTPVLNTWAISNNTAIPNSAFETLEILNDVVLPADGNYKVSARIDNKSVGNAGIVARYIDSNNYYMARTATGNKYEIYRKVSGTFLLLASATETVTNRYILLEFELSGNSLKLFADGVEVLSTTDNSFSNPGHVGLRKNSGDTPNVDDFTVTNLGGIERAAKTTGQEDESSERSAKITGIAADDSERSIKTTGKDTSSGERSSRTTGNLSDDDERAARLTGIGPENSERQSKATGKATTDSERASLVTGQESAQNERNSKATGQDTETSERSSKATGKIDIDSERNSLIIGKTVTNEERAALLRGQVTALSGIDRVNLCSNPSFETTAAGFWSGNASRSNDYSKHGSYSAKVTCIFTSGVITGGHNYLNTGSSPITSVIGKKYVYSAYIFVPSGSGITKVNLAIRRHSNYANLSTGTTKTVVPGQWTRFSVEWIATEAIQLRFTVADPQATGFTGTASYYIDGVLIEEADGIEPYFDGSVNDGTWTGAAHTSTSIKTEYPIDERAIKTTGQDTDSNERSARSLGQDSAEDVRSSRTTGKATADGERAIKTTGQDTTSSEYISKITGAATENDTRAATIHGEDTTEDQRAATLRGTDTEESERSAIVTGITTSTGQRGARLWGKDYSTPAAGDWYETDSTEYQESISTNWYKEPKK